MNCTEYARALLALAWLAQTAGCNDDLLGYRLARLADIDAKADGSSQPETTAANGKADAGAEAIGRRLPDTEATDLNLAESKQDSQADLADGVTLDCELQFCGDDNPCTTDTCVNGQCVHAFAEAGCEDGDICTASDTCVEGACMPGSSTDCADNQPCTIDDCDKQTGCTHVSNDGGKCQTDACMTGGLCIGMDCVEASPQNCDDGNTCTDDTCDVKSGCVSTNQAAAPCDDGNGCTKDDICSQGQCEAGQGCGANAKCISEPELGQKCVCESGFSGDGFSCVK